MIEKLRNGVQRRLRGWLGIEDLRQMNLLDIRSLSNSLVDLSDRFKSLHKEAVVVNGKMHTLRQQASTHAQKLEDIDERVKGIEQALGGVAWTTARGERRFIVNLSTSHLENIIAGGFVFGEDKENMLKELRRRVFDSPRRTFDSAQSDSPEIKPVLINRSTRNRIKKLPKWAQTLIIELEASNE